MNGSRLLFAIAVLVLGAALGLGWYTLAHARGWAYVTSFNVIVKFTRAATLGVEYMWGDNHVLSGDKGWAQRLQFGLKYDLTK